jgi:hypothetical protein
MKEGERKISEGFYAGDCFLRMGSAEKVSCLFGGHLFYQCIFLPEKRRHNISTHLMSENGLCLFIDIRSVSLERERECEDHPLLMPCDPCVL